MSVLPVLGVDVSKATLDVQIGSQKHKSFRLRVSNDLEGFVRLETWLQQQGYQQVHVCLEPTGTYSDAFAHYMSAREHQVSLINPFRMKAFRQSEGLTNKSDRLDAWLLARYGEQKQPELWHPVRGSFQQLTQDLERYDDLKLMVQQEKNRLENQRLDQESRDDITAHIQWLEQRVIAWLKRMKQRFVQTWQQEEQDNTSQHDQTALSAPSTADESPALDALGMLKAVDEIKGFDVLSSFRVLALMEGLQHIGNAQQVAAYCGVVPGTWSSGTSVKGKPGIRHAGPAKVRKWLFLCALTTKRLDPDMARWAQELQQRGKKKMVVIVAVMRKLIHIFCGMFKSRMPYDPRKAFPSHYPKEEEYSALAAA